MDTVKLSVVVHTKNSAATLADTLRSAAFANEIVVIDMHSTDATLTIARTFTRKIYQHKDVGYVEPARNFGLAKAKGDWILVLDADETVSDGLRQSITDILQSPAADAYFLARKNLVFGKWIHKTGWWPDYQLRLFRRGAVRWQTGLHSVPDVSGMTAYLPADQAQVLVHLNYTSVTQFLEKLNSYTSLHTQEKPTGISQGHFSSQKALEVFAQEFAKRSLAQDGVEDGLHGVALSLLQAMYETTAYLKEWEAAGFPQADAKNLQPELKNVERIWRYWWADYQVRHSRGVKKWYWRWCRKRAS